MKESTNNTKALHFVMLWQLWIEKFLEKVIVTGENIPAYKRAHSLQAAFWIYGPQHRTL